MLLSGLICISLSNLFTIFPAQVVRTALDSVYDQIHNHSSEGVAQELIYFAGLVFLFALVRGIFLFWTRQSLIVLSRKIEFDQKNDLFHHFQSLNLSVLRKISTGDLMARISEDVSNVRMFTGPAIMYALNALTMFICLVATMFYVNPELTWYALLPMPVLSFSIYIVHSTIHKRSDENQKQLARLSTLTQEVFSGIRLIKAYRKEQSILNDFNNQSFIYKNKGIHLAKVDALFYPVITLLIGLSTLIVVWLGGYQVVRGVFTLGNIAEFIIYVNLLTWPVTSLGWVTSLIQRAAASQARIDEVLALNATQIFPDTETTLVNDYSIVFEDVSLRYEDSGILALDSISFKIEQGSLIGIMGATGCGKSTLAALIPRLIDCSSGKIYIGNVPIENLTKQQLRNLIGLVPQDVFLFSDTIFNNIAFGKPDATEKEVIQAAVFAGIYEDIMQFQNKFQTVVGERGVLLSGGQKQRISIARAYIRKPPILILDDSLSAVDTQTEESILKNLQFTHDYNPTVLLISHRVTSTVSAEKIIFIQQGRVVEYDSPEKLLAQKGAYAALYQKQQIEQEFYQHFSS